jgi:hypothetical protein
MGIGLGGYVDTGVGGTSHTPQHVGVTLLPNIIDALRFECEDRTYSVSLIGGEILPERVSRVENGEKTDDVDLGRAAKTYENTPMKEKDVWTYTKARLDDPCRSKRMRIMNTIALSSQFMFRPLCTASTYAIVGGN